MTDAFAHVPEKWRWFPQDRFGLFIHWGAYAAYGRGEQVLFREHIDQRDGLHHVEQRFFVGFCLALVPADKIIDEALNQVHCVCQINCLFWQLDTCIWEHVMFKRVWREIDV